MENIHGILRIGDHEHHLIEEEARGLHNFVSQYAAERGELEKLLNEEQEKISQLQQLIDDVEKETKEIKAAATKDNLREISQIDRENLAKRLKEVQKKRYLINKMIHRLAHIYQTEKKIEQEKLQKGQKLLKMLKKIDNDAMDLEKKEANAIHMGVFE